MEGSTFIFLLVKHYVSFNRWVFISVNDLLKEIQELPKKKKTFTLVKATEVIHPQPN